MTSRRWAALVAVSFFVFWLVVLLAGADFPPPPGFVVMVVIVLLCAVMVYRRVPTYVRRQQARLPYRRIMAVGDGLLAGLIVAVAAMLLPFDGEPGIPPPGPREWVIWCAVLAIVGMINAVAIDLATAWMTARSRMRVD